MESDIDQFRRNINLYVIIGSNVFAGNDAHEITGTPNPSALLEGEVQKILKALRLSEI